MENSDLQYLLDTLNRDIQFFKAQLKEVAVDMLDGGYTKYPVFAAHQHTLQLGELLFDKEEYQCNWSIHVTTLEELMEKGLIEKVREEEFIKAFKDPKLFMCVLMISPGNAHFAFVGY
ncbi:MAG: hypothetical protein SGJ10_04940 [Bacteroidota bacterium]|nr:hypothetical protein [Bacteroidota bacterium]